MVKESDKITVEVKNISAKVSNISEEVNKIFPKCNEIYDFEKLFTEKNIKKTWSQLRKELRKTPIRDVLDWIDWIYTIDKSLNLICDTVKEGSYSIKRPTRYEGAKPKGAFREFVCPNVKDALVYRHISDHIYELAKNSQTQGAYFSRKFSNKPIGRDFELTNDNYDDFFKIWITYNEYRTKTLLNDIYKILVITDISNFFDSISHDLLIEYLVPYGISRKTIGLLLKILEVLKPDCCHSSNPGLGIPVDEIDCSRQLAHIYLFEHDKRIIKVSGEGNYIRWMDDQNIGVKDYASARKIIYEINKSLAQQRLTINVGKTKFLTPEEVSIHFHLKTNQEINKWEKEWKKDNYGYKFEIDDALRSQAREKLITIYRNSENKKKGNWDKIIKRFLWHSIALKTGYWDRYFCDYIVEYPELTSRVFETLAKRNETDKLLKLFTDYINNKECLFETTEFLFFNSLLFLSPRSKKEESIRKFIIKYLSDQFPTSNKPLGKASALLCYYWFSSNLDDLVNITAKWDMLYTSSEVARALISIYSANPPRTLNIKEYLLNFISHSSDDVGKLSQFVLAIENGQKIHFNSFTNRKPRWEKDWYYDPRAWLGLELMSNNPNPYSWQTKKIKEFKALCITSQEKRIMNRIADKTKRKKI